MNFVGRLEEPILLHKWEKDKWVDKGGGVKVLRADWVSCPQAQVGDWVFLHWFSCSGKEQAGVQDSSNYLIWVTGELFICLVWHVSVDQGSCAVWKTDSTEVYLFILQTKQPYWTRLGRKRNSLPSFSKGQIFMFCPSLLCTESCGVVVSGEDMSSICLCSSLDQNTTLASNRCWDEFCEFSL